MASGRGVSGGYNSQVHAPIGSWVLVQPKETAVCFAQELAGTAICTTTADRATFIAPPGYLRLPLDEDFAHQSEHV